MKTINDLFTWCSEKSGRTVELDFDGKIWFAVLTQDCDKIGYFTHVSEEHETLETLLEDLSEWVKENENN